MAASDHLNYEQLQLFDPGPASPVKPSSTGRVTLIHSMPPSDPNFKYKGRTPLYHGSVGGIEGGVVRPTGSSHRGFQAFATPNKDVAAVHARRMATRMEETPLFAEIHPVEPLGEMGKSGKTLKDSYEVFSPYGMKVTGSPSYVKVANTDPNAFPHGTPVEYL